MPGTLRGAAFSGGAFGRGTGGAFHGRALGCGAFGGSAVDGGAFGGRALGGGAFGREAFSDDSFRVGAIAA